MKTTLITLTVLLFGAGGCVKLKAASSVNRQAVYSPEHSSVQESKVNKPQVSIVKYHQPINRSKK
jgi:hypothetical protein